MDSGAGSRQALQSAVSMLESIQTAIAALSGRSDDAWRRDLIALRRQLQHQISRIIQLLDDVALSSNETRELRAALSRMRSGLALHQASWPAVTIERDDPGYQQSVRDVRAANRDFIALISTALQRLQSR